MDAPGWEPTLQCLLAERFVPRSTPEVLASVIASCTASGQDSGIRLLQAIYVPDDETCFALLQASTAEDAALVGALQRLGFHRAKAALSIQLGRPGDG
jgi:hypothetical protein